MKLDGAGIINTYYLFKGKNDEKAKGNGVNITGDHIVNIPYYQRPYRWTSDNITNLFNDYSDNLIKTGAPSEYFVGATVSVERDGVFDLIDGQQRTTTIYLMNYVRYIIELKRVEHKLEVATGLGKATGDIRKLRDIYANLIGRYNYEKFEDLENSISDILSQIVNRDIEPDVAKERILALYKDTLGLVTKKCSSKDEYLGEAKKSLEEFFESEELCLNYSRPCYNDYLKNALCSVCIRDENMSSDIKIEIIKSDEDYNENYLNAIDTIFHVVKSYCQKKYPGIDEWELAERMVEYIGEVLDNLSFCMILTTDPDDAYTLFEVLNDRALDVDDLELVKNHFYREYCNKSGERDDTKKNKEIDKLDKLWVETIFAGSNSKPKRNRLVSYLATIYLTQSENYDNKNDTKCKNEIKKQYTDLNSTYSSKEIERDFNIFYAMRVMIDVFDIKFNQTDAVAIKAESNNTVSITYKTFDLLYALNRPAVLAALANVILAKYMSTDKDLDVKKFKAYLIGLKDDKTNSKTEYIEIHKCAFMLWKANIMASQYNTPRNELATEIIRKNGLKTGFSDVSNLLTVELQAKLKEEFTSWILNWSYSEKNCLCVKILFLNLFGCIRKSSGNGYDENTFTLTKSAYSYNLEPQNINLDHLEAAKVREPETAYFLYTDRDKRTEVVNSLGNMMILDSVDNNRKNNSPLKSSLVYYEKNMGHWMYIDIENMMKDTEYFDGDIPKIEFFDRRKKILVGCFSALLDSGLNDSDVKVSL